MILGISNQIFTKGTKFWQKLEIKETPVNQITGKNWNPVGWEILAILNLIRYDSFLFEKYPIGLIRYEPNLIRQRSGQMSSHFYILPKLSLFFPKSPPQYPHIS